MNYEYYANQRNLVEHRRRHQSQTRDKIRVNIIWCAWSSHPNEYAPIAWSSYSGTRTPVTRCGMNGRVTLRSLRTSGTYIRLQTNPATILWGTSDAMTSRLNAMTGSTSVMDCNPERLSVRLVANHFAGMS